MRERQEKALEREAPLDSCSQSNHTSWTQTVQKSSSYSPKSAGSNPTRDCLVICKTKFSRILSHIKIRQFSLISKSDNPKSQPQEDVIDYTYHQFPRSARVSAYLTATTITQESRVRIPKCGIYKSLQSRLWFLLHTGTISFLLFWKRTPSAPYSTGKGFLQPAL